MPRKDTYHEAVRIALQKDGWIITDDPLEVIAKVDGILDFTVP